MYNLDIIEHKKANANRTDINKWILMYLNKI